MCGIVGYIGAKSVVPLILDGLRRLEYRGYDSAGIAVVGDNGKLDIRRAPGKLRNLEESIRITPLDGVYGIGHTRWATHGRPTEENAHPHRDCNGEIVVVHNGIIENYIELKKQLIAEGHKFVTETDTEIIAHLIEKFSANDAPLEEAVLRAVKAMTGAYALVALSTKDPEQNCRRAPGAADRDRPRRKRIFRRQRHSRDPRAHAQRFLPRRRRNRRAHAAGQCSYRFRKPPDPAATPQHITWDPIMAEKGGFKHFMQKEIFEQPRAVRDTLLGRISQETGKVFLDEMDITEEEFRRLSAT